MKYLHNLEYYNVWYPGATILGSCDNFRMQDLDRVSRLLQQDFWEYIITGHFMSLSVSGSTMM